MRFLPVGLDLRDRPCVVVGGGAVGTRKARTLARVGARVTIVSPEIGEELAGDVKAGRIRWLREPFRPEHLEGARVAVLATDDAALNARAAREASARGILACDASSADGTELIFGALVEHDGVTLGAFTDGRDPARARRIRDAVALWLGAPRPNGSPSAPTDALLVLAAHGSRDPAWGRPLEALAEALRKRTGDQRVRLAYVQFASPSLEDVVADAARSGIRRVRVLPLFMTAEGHVERDIRPAVDALRRIHAEIEVTLLPPVGQLPSFERLLADIALEATR